MSRSSCKLFFVYLKEQEIKQVVCDFLFHHSELLSKIDRAKTVVSGERYRFSEAVKLNFDVSLNDTEDLRDFLDENDDDIVREYLKPFNLLQNDTFDISTGGFEEEPISFIFLFFNEIYGGAKERIHLDDAEAIGLEEVEINDVNDLRKTRSYMGVLSAVAKKARNRTRHFRGNL